MSSNKQNTYKLVSNFGTQDNKFLVEKIIGIFPNNDNGYKEAMVEIAIALAACNQFVEWSVFKDSVNLGVAYPTRFEGKQVLVSTMVGESNEDFQEASCVLTSNLEEGYESADLEYGEYSLQFDVIIADSHVLPPKDVIVSGFDSMEYHPRYAVLHGNGVISRHECMQSITTLSDYIDEMRLGDFVDFVAVGEIFRNQKDLQGVESIVLTDHTQSKAIHMPYNGQSVMELVEFYMNDFWKDGDQKVAIYKVVRINTPEQMIKQTDSAR
ncbi:hypothetical protein I3271_07470 [Photobacterium leiognathi]|uniref:hypothetical protein n=1 Tax=Photobacterium leiognathi TaxID=553611 RepID=UPI001EDD16A7|nr:hypothetical protein [Photobacterium leiognathi]MCG3884525.1 hypothetical protein [Photobacterium leiognathi]